MSDCTGDFKCPWCKGKRLTAEPPSKYGACREAELTDEITALRAEVERQKDHIKLLERDFRKDKFYYLGPNERYVDAEMWEKERERGDRLRAALKEILDYWDNGGEDIESCIHIAKAALKQETET